MKKVHAVLFAFLMMTMSLAGCLSGDNGEDGSEGPSGADGIDGADGLDGEDGLSSLISTSTSSPDENCANGGIKIESGIDDDSNGILSSEEVDAVEYICDGGSSVSTLLSSHSIPPNSMGCNIGGSVINYGLDNGDGGGVPANGQLELGEIDSSTTFCTSTLENRASMVEGITTDTRDSSATDFVSFNNQVYFKADDGINGDQIWTYDGINPPTVFFDINPDWLIEFNNELYFSHAWEDELWKYDGINPPTNVFTGSENWSASSIDPIVFNDEIYFRGGLSDYGSAAYNELWSFDGVNPPSMVADINTATTSGSYVEEFTIFDDKLFFAATNGFIENGNELWVYDGVNASMVADIKLGGSSSNPEQLTVFNNNLYFRASDGTHGYELWVYDGVNPPSMVADIGPGSSSGLSMGAELMAMEDILYFEADTAAYGQEIWRYDGINPPTIVADINPEGDGSPTNMIAFNNQLYFRADDGLHGTELWTYNGSMASMVADICPQTNRQSSSGALPYFVFDDALLFRADDIVHGMEVWEYDGNNPPSLIGDINNRDADTYIENVTIFNNELYFNAYGSIYGDELWKYDGTNPPSIVADIYPGANGSNPRWLTVFEEVLYFQADNGVNGTELWKYDGTNPPSIVDDIYPGISGSNPSWFTMFEEELYFQADDGVHGSELWKYDGTNTPSMVDDLNNGPGGSYPGELTAFPQWPYLFFSCDRGSGMELCYYNSESDSAGSFFMDDINNPQGLIIFKNKMYFAASGEGLGNEMWQMSIDEGGIAVFEIFDIFNGSFSSYPIHFTIYQDKLYFSAKGSSIEGYELWVYEGFDQPYLLIDLDPLPGNSSNPLELIVFNDQLYFRTDDYVLYTFDGIDFRQIDFVQYFSLRITFGGELYLTAADGHGMTLWKLTGPGTTITYN